MSTHPPRHDHPREEFPQPSRHFTVSEVLTTMAYIKVLDQKEFKISTCNLERAFKAVQITLKRLLLAGENNAKEMLAELKNLKDAETVVKELQDRLMYKDACRLKVKFVQGLTSLAAYVPEGIFYDYSDRTFHESESYKRPLLDYDPITSQPAAKVPRVSSDHPAANNYGNNVQMSNSPPFSRQRNPVPYNPVMNSHPGLNRAPTMNCPRKMNVHPKFNPPRPRMNQYPAPIPASMKSNPDSGVADHKIPYVEKSPVVVINGIEEGHFNCDVMFNLLCQYGDVIKVMFLKEKKLMMVQMALHEHARSVLEHLNNFSLFGCKMMMLMSNKAYLYQKFSSTLSDGTPSNKSYEESELHR